MTVTSGTVCAHNGSGTHLEVFMYATAWSKGRWYHRYNTVCCILWRIDRAKLASSGYGCRIFQHFVGELSYADVITLLSTSLKGLQYMMNICEEYGKEFHVTFNDTNTTGMVFGASNGNYKAIQVNGNNVDWVTNARHLGNVVDNKLSDLKEINVKKVILLRVLTGLWATSRRQSAYWMLYSTISIILQHSLWLNSMAITR